MDWLTQNWLWIVAAGAMFLVMGRIHGHGHSGHGGRRHDHGSHDVGDLAGRRDDSGHGAAAGDPREEEGRTLDPVSGRPVARDGTALSSVHLGRAYYFESRENRDIFEEDPARYVATAPDAGPAMGPAAGHEQRRRHGC